MKVLVKMYSKFGKFILAASHIDESRLENFLNDEFSNSPTQINTVILTIRHNIF